MISTKKLHKQFTDQWKTGDKVRILDADGKWRKGKIIWGFPGFGWFRVSFKKRIGAVLATWSQLRPRKKALKKQRKKHDRV